MIEDILKKKYGNFLKGLDIYENRGSLRLSRIIINDEFKGSGVGTKIMTDLINYADKNKQIIGLTPSSDFGGNKNRLIQFYKRFGFKHNKGIYKNYEISDTMIRYPKTMQEQKELIKSLLRENIDLRPDSETAEIQTFDVYYNKRKAGSITCGITASGLGKDTYEIESLDLEEDYGNLNVANQTIRTLWEVYPDINRFVIDVPNEAQPFWEKLGFNRLNDRYHMILRGHQ